MKPVLDKLTEVESLLSPFEKIKTDLAEARARYRTLTDDFVKELRHRCDALTESAKKALVLELMAEDIHISLSSAVAEKKHMVIRSVEALWDKYRVKLSELKEARGTAESALSRLLTTLEYS